MEARFTVLICYFVKLAKNNDRIAEDLNCILCKLLLSFLFLFLLLLLFLTACDVCTNTPVQPSTQYNVHLTLCSQFPVAGKEDQNFPNCSSSHVKLNMAAL